MTKKPLVTLDFHVRVRPLAEWPGWVRAAFAAGAVLLAFALGGAIIVAIGLAQDWINEALRHLGQ